MRATSGFSRAGLMDVLATVMDPEVPILSVVELGIVRDVSVNDASVVVTITPTYSGCPAMTVIEREIESALRAHGVEDIAIKTVYAPSWTSDWIPAEAREKLRAYGIAPPGPADRDAPIGIGRRRAAARCPYCGSADTELRSEFGSTACKAIHMCHGCRQPFEEFKAI